MKRWEITSNDEFPPEVSMDNPNWIAQCELNAVADAWDLKDLVTHAINDSKNKSSIVHFQVFMEREAEYYFWNIAMVYFIIIFLKSVIVAFPYTEARFDFAMTLALTTVAFMFVTTTMVPKTSYLTFMDKYMLIGLFLLFTRFLVDLGIILGFERTLPFGEEGIRGSCAVQGVEGPLNACVVDYVATILLGSIWLTYSIYFAIVTFLFQEWVRPSWEKLNKKEGDGAQEKEVAGVSDWLMEEKVIDNADLSDAVRYDVSAEGVSASATGGVSKR